MMEAARTSETSVDNHFTRQYNPEDSSEHNTAVDATDYVGKVTIQPMNLSLLMAMVCYS
jgi:hypothetical protein